MPAPAIAPEEYAARALRAYTAMQARFRKRDGMYRRDGLFHLPGTAAHVWPLARAMVGTLDLAGLDPALTGGFDAEAEIADRLEALERYYEPDGEYPAYASDPVGTRFGGDRYYDDNAWVGLALIELERLRPGAGRLDRAGELWRFAVGGWDTRTDVPSPGGVFWVEQGHGVGAKNHDRNTVSNAPNAELGLHLAELLGAGFRLPGPIAPEDMYSWVLGTLDESRETEAPGTGLFWDKIRADNTIDRLRWTYNQGSMVGLNVLLARRGGAGTGTGTGTGTGDYLARAEAIARKALRHYDAAELERQPPSFHAIFFRNLLLLHAATSDEGLREEIIASMRRYTDWAWNERRDARDRFSISDQDGLLDQSAMVQLLALLAWDPRDYGRLA
jgi:hypothetical protein